MNLRKRYPKQFFKIIFCLLKTFFSVLLLKFCSVRIERNCFAARKNRTKQTVNFVPKHKCSENKFKPFLHLRKDIIYASLKRYLEPV